MTAPAPGRVPTSCDEAIAPRVGIARTAPVGGADTVPVVIGEFLVLEVVTSRNPLQADELAHAFLGLWPRPGAARDDDDTAVTVIPSAGADPNKTAEMRTLTVRLVELPGGRQLVETRDHGTGTCCRLVGQIR